jgi:hypothetical protein
VNLDGTYFISNGWESNGAWSKVNCAGGVISTGSISTSTSVIPMVWGTMYSTGSGGAIKKHYVFGTSWSKVSPQYSGSLKLMAASDKWGLWPSFFANFLKILS